MNNLDLAGWLKAYQTSHTHPINIKIHYICVPLIMFSILGLLNQFSIFEINFAHILLVTSLFFYMRLGVKPTLVILFQSLFFLLIIYQLNKMPNALFIYISIFVASWIGQFIGHKIEGKKPSFFQDLQFLFIGPLWIWPLFKKSV
jgi:uncharacterized membrane protein YGL010W